MKTALFTNWTDQEFIGYWDGKAKKFPPGASIYMPDYLARHFAKHLTNRELLRTDVNGQPIHKDGEKMTSPKRPEEVPLFMELFHKAFQPDDIEELGSERDNIDALIGSANKNREKRASESEGEKPNAPTSNQRTTIPDVQENPRASIKTEESTDKPSAKQDPTKPQIIVPPDFDEDDDESSFEGKPQE